MRPRLALALAAIALTVAVPAPRAQQNDAPEYGPANGTLIIVGGGNLTGSGINEKFIELAGGPDKSFVIVPTAGGNRNAQGGLIAYDEQRIIAPWLRLGVKNVKMLHTHDPKFTMELAPDGAAPDKIGKGVIKRIHVPNSWAGDYTKYSKFISAAQEFFEQSFGEAVAKGESRRTLRRG